MAICKDKDSIQSTTPRSSANVTKSRPIELKKLMISLIKLLKTTKVHHQKEICLHNKKKIWLIIKNKIQLKLESFSKKLKLKSSEKHLM